MTVHAENFQVFPEALAPGTEVNGWRVLERLGAGGFGAAYLVESPQRPGEFFALKIARHLQDDRVGREIGLLMTRAIHPHVVRLHGFGRWPHPVTGYLYFIMDWVQGLPLHTWAETHNPSLRVAVEKLATVALTLEHLHAEGVLHRDLKPEHMLVGDSDGKPMLIDFGVGWHDGVDTLTTQGMAPGTPHLRPPEAVAFWRKRGGKAGQRYEYKPTDDVYSLGVSTYRVLTGHWPFPPHLDREALFGAIESVTPPAPSRVNARIPPSVSDVIMRMMAKKPRDRFPSCGEAHVSLVAALTFAGNEIIEAPLFEWEKPSEAEQKSDTPQRKVRIPEWPTVTKSASAPEEKPSAAAQADGDKKKASPKDNSEPPPPPPAKPRWWRRIRFGEREAFWLMVLLVVVTMGRIIDTLRNHPLRSHPTPEVVRKSSALVGQKLALEPEWVEPFWAAVPQREPTPAVVVSTTNSEEASSVKTQKIIQAAAQPAPEPPREKPTQKVLEGARKALAVAACSALTGCASLSPLPPKGIACSEQAKKDMKALHVGYINLLPLEYANEHHSKVITVHEGSFTWTALYFGFTRIPPGSRFIGQLWVRDRLYGRVERILTPEGKEYAVCLELERNDTIPATRDEGEEQDPEPGANLAEPSTEQGVGKIRLVDLKFHAMQVWGDPRQSHAPGM